MKIPPRNRRGNLNLEFFASTSLKNRIRKACAEQKPVTVRAYRIDDAEEEKLKFIIAEILAFLKRDDLASPLFGALREIVQNACNANIRRAIFDAHQLDPLAPEQYEKGMVIFRKSLAETKWSEHLEILKKNRLSYAISFRFSKRVLTATVRNRISIFPIEERRIRKSFDTSKNIKDLFVFFQDHGDSSEGAGMGIALVQLLLCQAEMDPHNFSIYAENGQTVSRIIMPIVADYVTPRRQFDLELEERGVSPEELRGLIRKGVVKLELF